MGAVKSLIMDGEEFAQENYNMGRNEFVAEAWTFAKGNNIIHRAAIEHYDVIKEEMAEYQLEIGKND